MNVQALRRSRFGVRAVAKILVNSPGVREQVTGQHPGHPKRLDCLAKAVACAVQALWVQEHSDFERGQLPVPESIQVGVAHSEGKDGVEEVVEPLSLDNQSHPTQGG